MSKRLTVYERYLRDAERRKREVLDLYEKKWRQKDIARRLGISQQRVSQILKGVA